MNRKISSIVLLTCLSGLALIAFPFVDAAPPDTDARHESHEPQRMRLEKLSIVTGNVATWTTNKGGDVDGFTVGENVVVHFPPHHGEQVSAWLKLEDEVTVLAKPKSRPDGTKVMEAVVLQRGDDAMQVPGPKPRPEQASDREEQLMSVRGKVTELHENREGIIDGFKVDAKTEVKFPPHQSKAIMASVQVGGEVVINGRRHETPKGDIHVHADRISSGDSEIAIDRPEPKTNDGPPPHAKMGPQGHESGVKEDREYGKPPHVQIVDELRKIRELLEEQGSR